MSLNTSKSQLDAFFQVACGYSILLEFPKSLLELAEQGKLLQRVAELVDAGTLRSTLGEHYGAINAANLKRAHALLESGKARGKLVLEGF